MAQPQYDESFQKRILRRSAHLAQTFSLRRAGFLVGLLISTAFAAFYSNVFAVLFALQIAFYLVAFLGWITNLKIPAIPHYFVLANLASVIAFYKFLRGETYARWEPIRESSANPADMN